MEPSSNQFFFFFFNFFLKKISVANFCRLVDFFPLKMQKMNVLTVSNLKLSDSRSGCSRLANNAEG